MVVTTYEEQVSTQVSGWGINSDSGVMQERRERQKEKEKDVEENILGRISRGRLSARSFSLTCWCFWGNVLLRLRADGGSHSGYSWWQSGTLEVIRVVMGSLSLEGTW